jgi:hypothetical protein
LQTRGRGHAGDSTADDGDVILDGLQVWAIWHGTRSCDMRRRRAAACVIYGSDGYEEGALWERGEQALVILLDDSLPKGERHRVFTGGMERRAPDLP